METLASSFFHVLGRGDDPLDVSESANFIKGGFLSMATVEGAFDGLFESSVSYIGWPSFGHLFRRD